jgi:hypothetical protein
MALLHRRQAPPVAALARLAAGERVVSWADTRSGEVLLATPRGLWWPGPDGPRLIGWQHVDKAVWREGRLTVVEAQVVDDLLLVDRPAVMVEVSTPRDLPATVRRRVEANVVGTELRAFGDGAARLVARRVPGHDGVVWWARLEGGLRDSEQVRAHVSAEIARLRAEWAETRQLAP